jgi:hypothetical protein
MGLFWDLIQQSQISDQRSRASTLEARVAALEQELRETQRLVQSLLLRLETHFGKDFDGDGQIG